MLESFGCGLYTSAAYTRVFTVFLNFENCARRQKELKDYKHNSPHLGLQDARIFVLGHYLFLVAHIFPWAALLENSLLLREDHVRGQIS